MPDAIAALLTAPWWSAFLREKDKQTWAELSQRFGVTETKLRAALARAGLTKAPMPTGTRPKTDRIFVAGPPPNEVLRREAGVLPDDEVAAAAGVTAAEVKAYRDLYGISASFRQPAPRPPAPRPPPPKPQAAKASAPKPPAPKPTSPKSTPAHPLEPFRALLGTMGDGAIAQKAGIHAWKVSAWRKDLGIPAYDGFRFKKATTKTLVAEPAPVDGPSGRGTRRSHVQAYAHIVGTVPDHQIAILAGVTDGAVLQYRRKHGIPAFGATEAPPKRKVAPLAPPVVVQPAPVAPPVVVQPAPVAPPVVVQPAPVAPPVVAEPAPVVAEPAPVASPTVIGYRVRATNKAGEQRFLVVGADILAAGERAMAALARRTDGPWRIRVIKQVAEALE